MSQDTLSTRSTPSAASPANAPAAASGPAARTTSPWGQETWLEPTPRPPVAEPRAYAVRELPRSYRDVRSYHAHIFFDEDNYEKAALLRRWIAERFSVELGHWNTGPRGPHVVPSFYFGFTLEQLSVIVPWLQLNSLGLSIMIHPNTDDPRADHLQYPFWLNHRQPVNGYILTDANIDYAIFPNTRPTIDAE